MLNSKDVVNRLEWMEVQEEPVFDNRFNKLERYKLIRRTSDKQMIHVPSQKFSTMSLLDSFNKVHKTVEDLGIRYELDGFQYDVADYKNRFKLEFRFPDISFDVDGSPVTASLNMRNSNDGTMGFGIMFGAYRLICSNGVTIGKHLINIQKKHVGEMEEIHINLEEGIEKLTIEMNEFKELIEKAQYVKLNEEMVKTLIQAGFSKRYMEDIENKIAEYVHHYDEHINTNTLWALYNTLSNYITHQVESQNIARAALLHEALRMFFYNRAGSYERRTQ